MRDFLDPARKLEYLACSGCNCVFVRYLGPHICYNLSIANEKARRHELV